MGMNYYAVKKKPSIERAIHIGKSSMGWRFLFHEINGIPDDYEIQIRTFNQWKEWLEKHVNIDKDYVILNEDNEEVTLDFFLALVERKQKEDNPENFVYAKNIDGYRFAEGEFS